MKYEKMRNELNQASIAKECAEWIKKKVEIKSFKKENPAQQRLIYIENEDDDNYENNEIFFGNVAGCNDAYVDYVM